MSEQKRKLEQDFRRLSELCLFLDAEKKELKARCAKAIQCIKFYKESGEHFGSNDGGNKARICLEELGEKE